MTTAQVLYTIAHFPLSRAISKSNHLVTASLQCVHILGFLLLLSSLTLISLRLLGLALTRQSVPKITVESARLLWLGAIMAISSGVLLFLSGPAHYYYNRAFDVKMLLLFAALLVNVTLLKRVGRREGAPGILARVSAVLSLLLWFGVSWAGRAIGFV
jgi:uncharacterized protein DUF6644